MSTHLLNLKKSKFISKVTNLARLFFQDNEWWIFAATNYPENLGTDSLYKEWQDTYKLAGIEFVEK